MSVAPAQLVVIDVPLRVPPLEDGVVLATQLTVSVGVREEREPATTLTKPFIIFSRDAFGDKTSWLTQLSIALFDPEGRTIEAFESAGIPFQRIRNRASVDGWDGGLLVIGEGLSYSKNRSLWEALIAAASRGVPVLCLAAGEGRLTLPVTEEPDYQLPACLRFRGRGVISELDKRLDARQWSSRTEIPVRRIHIRADGSRIVGEVADAAPGWSWIEMRFEDGSSLVYCGFEIIESWDDGPTPRYLLARLFAHLTESSRDLPHERARGEGQ